MSGTLSECYSFTEGRNLEVQIKVQMVVASVSVVRATETFTRAGLMGCCALYPRSGRRRDESRDSVVRKSLLGIDTLAC